MGFPLELVIRVADKMGSDDKKVIKTVPQQCHL